MLELIRLFFLSYFKEFTFLKFHLICFKDDKSYIQNIEDEINNVEKFIIILIDIIKARIKLLLMERKWFFQRT